MRNRVKKNVVNDEHDVHVINLLQGQDPGQTRGNMVGLVEDGLDCLP